MAQLAIGIAGAAVGFALGGVPGAKWGFLLGTTAGGAMFPPKLPDGPRLNDRQVLSSAYGETIPRVYGAYVISGNVIWSTDLIERATTQGGKGGGPEYTTYSYSVSCAISLCKGEIIGLRRIWADGKLFWDSRQSSDEQAEDGSIIDFYNDFLRRLTQLWQNMTIYTGSETQTPDPTIVSYEGNAPAYRGEAYIVFTGLELEKFGNRIPQFRFEVVAKGNSNAPQAATWDSVIPGLPAQTRGNWFVNDEQTNRVWSPGFGTWGFGFIYDLQSKTFIKQFVPSRYPNLVSNPLIIDLIYVPPQREMWGLSKYNTGDPDYWYLDIWDCDSLELKQTIVITDPGSFDDDPSKLVFNPVNQDVVVMTKGAYNYYFYTVNSTIKAPVTAYALVGNENDDAFHFGNCIVATSVINGASTGGYISVYNAVTYALIYSKTLNTMVQVTQNGNYFRDKYRPIYAVDTIRNRLVTISQSRNINGKHNWIIFDTNMSIVTQGELSAGTSPCYNIFYDSINDEIWAQMSDETSYVLDPRDMSVKRSFALNSNTSFWTESAQYKGTYFSVQAYGASEDGVIFKVLNVTPSIDRTQVPLAEIVTAECELVGLQASDIDTSNLSGFSRGLMIPGQGSVRGGLEALMNAYLFDCVESGGKLKFVSRDRAATTNISADDLGVHDVGENAPTPLPFTRADETAQPRSITVRYSDFENEYQQGAQTAQRYTTKANNEIIVEVPVAMRPGEAMQLATTALYSAWVSRSNTKFSTTWKHASVEPTDVVVIDGNSIRITNKLQTANRIEFEGALETNSIYAQKPVSGQTNVSTQDIKARGPTNPLLLDIRYLRDLDNNVGFYMGAGGREAGWPGAVVFKSIDAGLSYYEYETIVNESVIGTAITVLPESVENTVDDINSVKVRLTNSSRSLSSVTYEALLNGANACLIGNEVLQFRDAFLNADETYTLTGLLRGRRGSVTGGHAIADRFVLLTEAALVRAQMDSSEINLARDYKFATIGTLIQDAAKITFTNTAQCLKPVAPVLLGGGRTTAGSLTINWVRCSRLDTAWRDYVDVSLSETTESYEIDIYNNSSPPAVVRTIAAATNTASYTSTQQTTDFGSVQASIRMRVYQISSTFGRGDYVEAIL